MLIVDVQFMLNLVDFGLDEEELDERGRAVDGRVDVLQREARLIDEVKVLCQEILNPQQRGGRLLLPVICAPISLQSETSVTLCHCDDFSSNQGRQRLRVNHD